MDSRLFLKLKEWAKIILQPEFRKLQQEERQRYLEFSKVAQSLWKGREPLSSAGKTVLVMSSGMTATIGIELSLIEMLRVGGYSPIVLTYRHKWLEKHYHKWGVNNIIFWEDYTKDELLEDGLDQINSFEDVLNFEVCGSKVGKYAASQIMRAKRLGSFDPREKDVWGLLLNNIGEGIRYAYAAEKIMDEIKPDLALFIDRGYSPWGQIFDLCMKQNVDTLQWLTAHKDNALQLKRYHKGNESLHYAALSEKTWKYVCEMPWGKNKAEEVQQELYQNYATGMWFSEVGTQFNKKIKERDDLIKQLDLDPEKKTAIVFAHMFWDATFFYGKDLFVDYEDWFVQTIGVAIENPELNWIVKVHPANTIKDQRDGFTGIPCELAAIQKHFGSLPDHVKLVESESDISTYSLFSLMDYCITVRGTIGIEASVFGIPVLTAGTGRYDQLGFTIDSESKEAYLAKLKNIQEISPLSKEETELAQRYAYAVLLERPLKLDSIQLEYRQDEKATPVVTFCVDSIQELIDSPDFQKFLQWSCHSNDEDFLFSGFSCS